MSRGVMLMSGGIDSPVALNLMLRQGHEMTAVHLDNRPFTDDSPLAKVVDHLKSSRRATGSGFRSTCSPTGRPRSP